MSSKQSQQDSFPSEVVDAIGHYVYRLIDPRNGETFYVGKGSGDRVFSHGCDEGGFEEEDVSDNTARFREIRSAGLEVIRVIHRHGMDDPTAREVEAALIDAYPGLTNIASGIGADRGCMHTEELIRNLAAPTAEFWKKAILISVNRSVKHRDLYNAVRYAWRINKAKAEEADVVLATQMGIIRGAFQPRKPWLEATEENFRGRADGGGVPGRYGFVGEVASEKICNWYVGKRVPGALRKRGAANPIRYWFDRESADGSAHAEPGSIRDESPENRAPSG